MNTEQNFDTIPKFVPNVVLPGTVYGLSGYGLARGYDFLYTNSFKNRLPEHTFVGRAVFCGVATSRYLDHYRGKSDIRHNMLGCSVVGAVANLPLRQPVHIVHGAVVCTAMGLAYTLVRNQFD